MPFAITVRQAIIDGRGSFFAAAIACRHGFEVVAIDLDHVPVGHAEALRPRPR